MFESAELGHKIDKEIFRVEEPKLRAALLEAQERLRENGSFPVIILITVITGVDGSGKGETINVLHEWMDQLNRFEAMLVNEGSLVLKFWIHLSKDAQRERLKTIEMNPLTRWRVTTASWHRLKTCDKMQEVAGHLLRTTNTPWAPWTIVESNDRYFARIKVLPTICERLEKGLKVDPMKEVKVAAPRAGKAGSVKDLTGEETQDAKADGGKESKTQTAKDLGAKEVRAAKARKAAEASGKAGAAV